YCLELGHWGFSLNHQCLKEHVDEVLKARLGNQFPFNGVGKNWTDRFVEEHSDMVGS
ncbi:hypothetical protein SERLA73DRAFT_29186, partial [Serpula lacrymans var. lacrymans S7.3]